MGRRGRRVATIAVLSGAVIIALPMTAGAQSAPPAFVKGEASASADTVALRAQLGQANVGYTIGRSLAHYQEAEGTGEGRALDLEALPTLFGDVAACPGVEPQLPAKSLPPVTSVATGDPGAGQLSQPVKVYFPELQKGVSNLLVGSQSAMATTQPLGTGVTTTETQDLGLVSIWGGHSTSTADLNGKVREATATMQADHIGLFGNAIVLDNPKWTATAHSGDDTTVTGSFTVDGGRAFGIQRTASQIKGDLSWVAGAASQIFSIIGLHVDLPKVVVDGKSVQVTPLAVRLTNIPLGQQLVGPLLGLFQTQIETYYQQLRDSGCQGESTAQITRLLQGVLSGSGTVGLTFGGASATTDDTYYPPLDLGGPTPAVGAVSDTGFTTPTDSALDTTPVDTTGSVTPTADTGPLDTTLATQPTDALPIAPIAQSTPTSVDTGSREVADASRVRAKGGDTGDAAALVGLLGILAAVILAIADRLHIVRGRRRVIPS